MPVICANQTVGELTIIFFFQRTHRLFLVYRAIDFSSSNNLLYIGHALKTYTTIVAVKQLNIQGSLMYAHLALLYRLHKLWLSTPYKLTLFHNELN